MIALLPGGNWTGPGEFKFFLYFFAKFFEFGFNPRCKTGWLPGNLDRVFQLWQMLTERDRLVDSVLTREIMGQERPVFGHVLRSVNEMQMNVIVFKFLSSSSKECMEETEGYTLFLILLLL